SVSRKAIGLDGALRELARSHYGPLLLGVIGFSLFSTAEARYRRSNARPLVRKSSPTATASSAPGCRRGGHQRRLPGPNASLSLLGSPRQRSAGGHWRSSV